MEFDNILLPSCPLCQIFLNPKDNIYTKLHYPEFDKVRESDFVILDCESCKTPLIVPRDHVTSINKELWGKILYQARRIFGKDIQLRTKPKKILDHHHLHLVNK